MATNSTATQAQDARRDVAHDFMGNLWGVTLFPEQRKSIPLRQAGKTQYSTKLREF